MSLKARLTKATYDNTLKVAHDATPPFEFDPDKLSAYCATLNDDLIKAAHSGKHDFSFTLTTSIDDCFPTYEQSVSYYDLRHCPPKPHCEQAYNSDNRYSLVFATRLSPPGFLAWYCNALCAYSPHSVATNARTTLTTRTQNTIEDALHAIVTHWNSDPLNDGVLASIHTHVESRRIGDTIDSVLHTGLRFDWTTPESPTLATLRLKAAKRHAQWTIARNDLDYALTQAAAAHCEENKRNKYIDF